MADIEDRIRTFLKTINPHGGEQEEEDSGTGGGGGGGGIAVCGGGDTFAERAEWFFKKRPELLSLVQELFNGYISLKENSKHHQRRHSSSSSPFDNKVLTVQSSQDTRTPQFGLQHINYFHNFLDQQQQQEEQEIDTSWDVESSVSYHQTPTTIDEEHHNHLHNHQGKALFRIGSWSTYPDTTTSSISATGFDEFVTNLVMKNVEGEIMKAQIGETEQQNKDFLRKMEILNKLIEVLESEREVLLSENSRLGYKVSNLMEENHGLVSEIVFLKRKAAQLSRCVMKMREDQSVCVLISKIEDLETQIHGLEIKNKEYYCKKKKKEFNLGLMGCFQSGRMEIKKSNEEEEEEEEKESVEVKIRGRKWWDKVKKGINFHGFSSFSSSSSRTST